MLGTLPDSWEIFRTSLSNSAPNGILSMDLVKSSVLNEEMRRKSQSSFVQSNVLVTKRRGGVKVKVREVIAEAKARVAVLQMLSVIIAMKKGI